MPSESIHGMEEEKRSNAVGDHRLHVLIAGGGVAGLEAVLALSDLAGDAVEVTWVTPEPDFTYRPHLIEESFSSRPAERLQLEPIARDFGVTLISGRVKAVDAPEHRIVLSDDERIDYGVALICAGATLNAPYASAETLYGRGEPFVIDHCLRDAAANSSRRLALVVPPGVSWPLPLYEAALLAQRRAAELDLSVEIEIVTPEAEPLGMFGLVASEAVAELLAGRRIRLTHGASATEEDGGFVLHPRGQGLECGAVVTLPTLSGPEISGLTNDRDGFIEVDQHSRVAAIEDVYAAGDGTNFPIKQGGLATQQADAAVEHIAARAGTLESPAPFHPVLRGKLWTADESLSMRQDLTGGHGEGAASTDYLWWPPHKISGRYLAPWLAGETAHADPEPPSRPIEVEVALPTSWYETPQLFSPAASVDRPD